MAHILIVDDSEVFCAVAARVFQEMGHGVDVAYTLEAGLAALRPDHDVVFLDVSLPDGNGIEAMPGFAGTPDPPEIIVITASADPEGAAEAVGFGAWDYVEKEASLDKLRKALLLALRHRAETRQDTPAARVLRQGLVGESPRLVACLDQMARAAVTGASILIAGETGTGKELFARAVQANSSRRDGPFVVMDCGAIPTHLTESILFGHVRGAFTGAAKGAAGLVRQATGGTLFLDEVGELSLDIQKSFLRVLQERRYRPVGGETELASDFRLVAATNKDLASMVATGEFRSDLLYRLNAVEIRVPALRERLTDIPLLAAHHLSRSRRGEDGPSRTLSDEFLNALARYNWPGNIRELNNAMDTAVVNSFGSTTLFPKHLPGYIRQDLARRAVASLHPHQDESEARGGGEDFGSWKAQRNRVVAAAARDYFTALLRRVNGDVAQACRLSSLSSQHFYATLKKYDISPRDWRER
jgi:two-component system, NtrC family, response regulator